MPIKNLREFISLLEDQGELKRITVPVSRDLEITEIADRTVKSGGPALLFDNVADSTMPLVINLYGTEGFAWKGSQDWNNNGLPHLGQISLSAQAA